MSYKDFAYSCSSFSPYLINGIVDLRTSLVDQEVERLKKENPNISDDELEQYKLERNIQMMLREQELIHDLYSTKDSSKSESGSFICNAIIVVLLVAMTVFSMCIIIDGLIHR